MIAEVVKACDTPSNVRVLARRRVAFAEPRRAYSACSLKGTRNISGVPLYTIRLVMSYRVQSPALVGYRDTACGCGNGGGYEARLMPAVAITVCS